MGEENRGTLFEDITNENMEYLRGMDPNDENYKEQATIVCNMIGKLTEAMKVNNADWEVSAKLEAESESIKTKFEHDKEFENLKHEHELEILKKNAEMAEINHTREMRLLMKKEEHDTRIQQMNIEVKEKEIFQKEKQVEIDKIKVYVDIASTVVVTGTLVIFEILAHKRDMADVIGSDVMHVKNNPVFGKIRLFK